MVAGVLVLVVRLAFLRDLIAFREASHSAMVKRLDALERYRGPRVIHPPVPPRWRIGKPQTVEQWRQQYGVTA